MGTARLASQPHSPAGAGQAGPLCACGGGAGPPSWAGGREGALLRTGLPRPLRELSGEEAPASGRASRLALGAALGAPLFPRASSPHAPFRTQLGAREDPAHPASTPPSAVRENAGPLGLCTRCWRRNSRQRLHFPWAPASPRRREFGQMVRKPFSGRPPSVGHIVGHRANFRIA